MALPEPPQRLLVLANEICMGEELFEAMRERSDGGDGDSDVLVVAPALTSRIRYWMSDEDPGIAEAGWRLEASLEQCGAAGVSARGALGDADPLQALDDAVFSFSPDEIIIATRPESSSNWLEEGLVAQARDRYSQPITHVVVDTAANTSFVADPRATRRVPTSSTSRDFTILAGAWLLAVIGTLISFVFYVVDARDWIIWIWVLVFDLGFKVVAAVLVWLMFQRRPRADRLDI